MSTVQVTIAYGPEYAGVPVRLYGSLDSGSQASLPFTPVNIGSLVLKTDSLVLIAQSVLGENGKVTFQWDETEHDVVIYQAAAQLVSGWRLSNPLIIPSNLVPPNLVPPDITSHPTGGEYDGETAFTLTVVATGSEPLSYQWYIGSSGVTDTPVDGATDASYDAEPEEDTMYWCRVTNAAGSADSSTALVTVPLVNPDTFTDLRANFGFAEADITFSPPTQVQTVSGNLGTGEIGTGGAVTWNAYGNGVTWDANPVGNGRPGCSFDEVSVLRTANTSPAEVITYSEFWIAVVAQIDTGGVNTNSGTSYGNDGVINDALSYFGLFLQSTGDVMGMNWDATEDVAEITGGFSFDTPHLFVLRHLNGKVGVSIDGGAFTEVDSGNTQSLSSIYIELFKSTAGTVQRVMIHDSVPSNAADIVAALRAWYGTA